MSVANLAQLLEERSGLADRGITFIGKSGLQEFLSYHDLYGAALGGLCALQESGLVQGDELILLTDDNKAFVVAFWACVLGGFVPVPLATGRSDEHKKKLFTVWAVLRRPALFTSAEQLKRVEAYAYQTGLQGSYAAMEAGYMAESSLTTAHANGTPAGISEEDTALIQFSSGSTGRPKGVVLSHRNLLVNMRGISNAAGYTIADSMLSWMPLTHDMGLIGFHLNPLLIGMDQYLLPTQLFVLRPQLWMDIASRHRVTILCSPNFGYSYFLKHASPVPSGDWHLSAVRLIYNGAEPVSYDLCREFLDFLSPYGLNAGVMRPVYGLAEASLAVTIPAPNEDIVFVKLDRHRLGVGQPVVALPEEADGVTVVNVGLPIDCCVVRITGQQDALLGEGTIGHIQICGSSVTAGYYRDGGNTADAFTPDGWLRTGDLGFMLDGCLYVTGRSKDIVIVNGQNYYPHDLERVVQDALAIDLNKVAIAGFFNTETNREEMLVFVFHRGGPEGFPGIAAAVKAALASSTGLEADHILPAKDIPRTTSGKLQRFLLVEWYRQGRFADVEGALREAMEEMPGRGVNTGPGTAAERRMLTIWEQVLGSAFSSVDRSFFEAGGNSLKAVEISMLTAREFGVDLSPDVLYEHPTVRLLTAKLESLGRSRHGAIPVAERREWYPLTAAQLPLFHAWQLDKLSISYNIPMAFEIGGQVDADQLERAAQQLTNRHDVLRMSFTDRGEAGFRVADGVDLRPMRLSCERGSLDSLLQSLVQPFDLCQAPLMRMALITASTGETILFLDVHHIIADGVSIHRLLTELSGLYAGRSLPEVSVQYRDHACWQAGGHKEQDAGYWLGQLEGELPVLHLPLDFERPAQFRPEGHRLLFSFDGDLSARLRAKARAYECSLHVLLFSLYALWLSKYCGEDDLLIGIPVAGRNHPDLQGVLGMFVNQLPVRVNTGRDETFAEFAGRVKQVMAGALDHQGYPFYDLLQALGKKRDISRNPLFDTMFVYQNMGTPAMQGGTLSFHRHFFDAGYSKFDLSLEVVDGETEISYVFEYCSRLFSEGSVLQMATHFHRLTREIAGNGPARLPGLTMLSREEEWTFTTEFNATACEYPREKTIHQLFEEQVARTPDTIAIEQLSHTVTFRQLDQRAGRLAVALKEKGLRGNETVAIRLRRSPDLIAGILGILKAGGCYLPLEPDWPAARIALLLDNSRCRFLITGDDDPRIERLEPGGPGGEPAVEASAMCSDDLAYILYTSGTTGIPKGVMISHRSLVNYTLWAVKKYIGDAAEVFPFYTSIAFDLTVTSIFPPLISGNRIIIYGDDNGALAIDKVMADNKATVIKVTPSHLKLLAGRDLLPGGQGRSRIKRFIVGGERLDTRLALAVYDRWGRNVEIYNEYGPTEATVGCMLHRFDGDPHLLSVPIGVPADNMLIYVLDRYLRPVPENVAGELYISGEGVARGYLFNEALTQERFIDNPFVPGSRMYRTGDLARRLSSGILEYLGRRDQQVKLNGYRIEPGEIEEQLRTHPAIGDVVVTVRSDPRGQQVLCAYVRRADRRNEKGLSSELQAYLAVRLPYYMIPRYFIRIDELPLTGNGKIDVSALPLPADDDGGEESEAAPVNVKEELMVEIWETVLGVRPVKVEDNFFHLGGDSIRAAQIASRLFEKGIFVAIADILTHQTIRRINTYAQTTPTGTIYAQGIISGKRGWTPIESWFFDQAFVAPAYYHQSILLEWKRKPDIVILEEAFNRLLQRHDGLRLNADPDGRSMYYNARALKERFALRVHRSPEGHNDDGLANLCTNIRRGLDIRNDLLFRAALICDGVHADLLFITAHHLVIDAFSWRILLEDLYELYTSLEAGETVVPFRKTASSLDWYRHLQEYAGTEEFRQELGYWETLRSPSLDGSAVMRPPTTEGKVPGKVTASLARDQTDLLLKQANVPYKTDTFILLNVALALCLKEFTGASRFVIEHENHGRHIPTVDCNRTVGWFTVMYPMVLQLPGGGLGSQVKAIKEQIRRIPRNGMAYGIGKYILGEDMGVGPGEPMVRFNYLGQFDQELNNDLFRYSACGTGPESDTANGPTAKLEMNIFVMDGELRLELNYDTALVDATMAGRLKELFFQALSRLLDYLGQQENVFFTPSDFSLATLDQEELDALFGSQGEG